MASSSVVREIDHIVRKAMADQAIPGLSLGVSKNGVSLVERGYGYRNVGDELLSTKHTTYRIASLTKQFTAAAIMRLHERGSLSLDDQVRSYFPWLPYAGISVRHLLAQTSGIPNFTALDDLDHLCLKDATPKEVVETVLQIPAAFAPGEDWQYSNTNYILLGMLIELISGASYEETLKKEFFEPLGMNSTGLDDPFAVRGNHAAGYSAFYLGKWEAVRWYPTWEFSTGGLCSTVGDLLKWNLALRRGRVLTADSWEQMARPSALKNGLKTNYGFGLQVLQLGDLREIRHTGGLAGLHTENTMYPEVDVDVVILCNIDMISNYFTIVRPVLELLAGVQRDVPTSTEYRTNRRALEPPESFRIIRGFLRNAFETFPLTERFRRFLTPKRRDALRGLVSLGVPRSIELVSSERWAQRLASFSYRLEFAQSCVRADLRVRDDGCVDHFNIFRWDGNPKS